MRVLAIASDAQQADGARSAGADSVLVEPFPIADLVDAVRGLARGGDAGVIDLRSGQTVAAAAVAADDAPWWATR